MSRWHGSTSASQAARGKVLTEEEEKYLEELYEPVKIVGHS
jgi:hypothetical protein